MHATSTRLFVGSYHHHHRERQTGVASSSSSHTANDKSRRAETPLLAASNPFIDDSIPYPDPDNLPNRHEWKKTFTTENDGTRCCVRACDLSDVPAVASLLLRSKLAGFPTEEAALNKYVEKSLDAFPRGAYLVCVKENGGSEKCSSSVVGVVGVSNTPDTRKDFERALQFSEDGGYISDLVIEPRCRGAGLGEKLMLCAESLCREMNRNEVYLHVSTRKVGVIRLYEKIGYEEVRSNFLRRDLLMRKKI
jgi:ribosomal protein S18 acetylase RimI-like enzyme